uniref:Secretory phospholipase A2 receptor-like isoform X2 n=1 Tax=Crassostrea virginica TaxID=6565 RepID=A0A8B8C5E0_CRAVI|nr:secretory phospholipase A2 receptor-like isoform X2 [Crassostrea virginica]
MMYPDDGTWNDLECDDNLPFVCEKITADDTCNSSWKYENEHWYRLFKSKIPWLEASQRCQDLNSTIVEIENQAENDIVRDLLKGENTWLGGNDRTVEQTWEWSGNLSAWNYTNWRKNQPDDYSREQCVMMYPDGTWEDIYCSNTLPFVCKKIKCSDGSYGKECQDTCGYCADQDVCHHTNGSCPNGCEAGYQGILCKAHCMNGTYGNNCSNTCGHCLDGGTCFHVNGTCLLGCDSGYTGSLCKFRGFQSPWENKDGQSFRVFTSRLDWHEAFRICVDNNSTLADIANPRENVFVRDLLKGNDGWLGGSLRREDRTWGWTGSSLAWNYTNWRTSKPDGGEDCLMMYPDDGTWNDLECTDFLPFVCEKITAGDTCNFSWKHENEHCYRLFKLKNQWPEALRRCQDLNSTLVEIENQAENDFVRDLLNGENTWLGGNDRTTEQTWEWSGNLSAWNYTNWRKDQPDDYREHCVMMYTDGTWDDRHCSIALPFVCEKISDMFAEVYSGE